MKAQGVYSIVEDHYVLDIYYDYYWDNGDYYQPPESSIEIEKVELNGEDITDFYILHEGFIGVFDQELKEDDYDDIE